MSKLTAAYMAGFVDGEGYISVYPYTREAERGNRIYYKPIFKIANTDKKIIEWCKASFGGWIYVRTPKSPQESISYTWSTDSKNMEYILRSIHPYLRIKKRQCELVLERIQISEKRRRGSLSPDRGVSYCKDTGKYRAYIYLNGNQTNLGVYPTKEKAIQTYMKALREVNPNYSPIDPKDEERILEIYQELRKLNKRGPDDFLHAERLSEATSKRGSDSLTLQE
jgi:hypothetical protein